MKASSQEFGTARVSCEPECCWMAYDHFFKCSSRGVPSSPETLKTIWFSWAFFIKNVFPTRLLPITATISASCDCRTSRKISFFFPDQWMELPCWAFFLSENLWRTTTFRCKDNVYLSEKCCLFITFRSKHCFVSSENSIFGRGEDFGRAFAFFYHKLAARARPKFYRKNASNHWNGRWADFEIMSIWIFISK